MPMTAVRRSPTSSKTKSYRWITSGEIPTLTARIPITTPKAASVTMTTSRDGSVYGEPRKRIPQRILAHSTRVSCEASTSTSGGSCAMGTSRVGIFLFHLPDDHTPARRFPFRVGVGIGIGIDLFFFVVDDAKDLAPSPPRNAKAA